MHHCDDDAPRHIGAVSEPLMSPQRRRYLAFHAGATQSQGFTTRYAIERSMVCASVSEDSDGQKVTQTKVTQQDIKNMAICLRSLGFKQQPHATKDEQGKRTRRWFLEGHMPGTPDTAESESTVQGQKPDQQIDLLPPTQQHRAV